MENKPIYSSLAHTKYGFMTNLFDPIADSKLFLLTSSSELIRGRNSKKFVLLRNIVRNIFGELSVDIETGWDEINKYSASDVISDSIENISIESKIFDEKLYMCIDIIQSLITLPLKNEGKNYIKKSFDVMVSQFFKIEEAINDTTKSLYVFKKMIDSCNEYKKKYCNAVRNTDKKLYTDIIKQFSNDVFYAIRHVANFCSPKNIDFARLLCSCISFSRSCQKFI